MKEQLISFETAVLAKEKGLEAEDDATQYSTTGKLEYQLCDLIDYYAPTQGLLQKWLREKHNLMIIVGHNYEFGFTWKIRTMGSAEIRIEGGFSKIYEEALEKGLQEALKLIKNK